MEQLHTFHGQLRRDRLPIHNRISDIAGRTANIAEAAILREGGKKMGKKIERMDRSSTYSRTGVVIEVI